MAFVHGFVHCDPHPGNLLARRRPNGRTGEAQIVLLDHGMYRQLEPSFRLHYSRLWASLLASDHDGGRSAARSLGVPVTDYDALSLILTFRQAESSQVPHRAASHRTAPRLASPRLAPPHLLPGLT